MLQLPADTSEAVVICFVTAIAVSCTDTTAPEDRLDLAVRAEPSVIVAGDSAFIEITIVNRSASSVTVTSPNSCLIDFVVSNATEDFVASSGLICSTVVTDHEFPPRFSGTSTFIWTTRENQPAGDYSVRAVMLLFQTDAKFSEPVQVRVLASG